MWSKVSLRRLLDPAGIALGLLGLTAVLAGVCLILVIASGADSTNTWATYYVSLTWVALAVVLLVFIGACLARRIDLDFGPWLPVLLGAISFAAALVPWIAIVTGHSAAASAIYREQGVPQGEVPFWDLVLPLRSIDCANAGFDVYADGNGCLEDPTIYGPGVLWLRFVPGLFTASHARVTLAAVISATPSRSARPAVNSPGTNRSQSTPGP